LMVQANAICFLWYCTSRRRTRAVLHTETTCASCMNLKKLHRLDDASTCGKRIPSSPYTCRLPVAARRPPPHRHNYHQSSSAIPYSEPQILISQAACDYVPRIETDDIAIHESCPLRIPFGFFSFDDPLSVPIELNQTPGNFRPYQHYQEAESNESNKGIPSWRNLPLSTFR
jgi:hypothetical protein